MIRIAKPALIVFGLLLISRVIPSWAFTDLHIEYERPATFLPYVMTQIVGRDWGTAKRFVLSPMKVLQVRDSLHETATIAVAANADLNADDPAGIHFQNRTNWSAILEVPLFYTIEDLGLCHSPEDSVPVVVAGCYRNDSAFVVRSDLNGNTAIRYLTTGRDRTGDGEWRPDIRYIAAVDYDHDNCEEIFFQVCPGRDREPRILFCLECDSLGIEWALPVASSIRPQGLFACGDSTDPAVIFVSYGPENGVADSNFDDRYGYVTTVDKRGLIIRNRRISDSLKTPVLGRLESGDFYLCHSRPLSDDTLYQHDAEGRHRLSLITEDLEPVASTPLSDGLQQPLWYNDLDGDGDTELHALTLKGEVIAFDSTFKMVARSNTTGLQMYLGSIALDGYGEPAQVFNTRSGVQVYSEQFRKLAASEVYAMECQPLAIDGAGNIEELILTNRNAYRQVSIRARSIVDLARIAIWEYQVYVLSLFSSAVAAFVVVNHYRRKAKHNLTLIRKQKEELEELHGKLKEAQAEIVAQEKYQQAKDIAGGFAHEIRNALLPAEGALLRLSDFRGEQEDTRKQEEYRERVSRALIRAIELTRLISTYTKLEALREPEEVNLNAVVAEILDANQIRIAEQAITIDLRLKESGTVVSNRRQLFLCLNNLLINSLDALIEGVNRRILIESEARNSHIRVSVFDHGVGIREQDLPRIFDAFYSTKPSSGTGLGLAMARKIIEMYGGSITVSSVYGQWTRFDLMLVRWSHVSQSERSSDVK